MGRPPKGTIESGGEGIFYVLITDQTLKEKGRGKGESLKMGERRRVGMREILSWCESPLHWKERGATLRNLSLKKKKIFN